MATDLDAARANEDTGPAHPPIPSVSPPPPGSVRVEFGGRTHPGKVRPNNEDHFLIARLSKSMRVCKTSLEQPGKTQSSDEEGYLMVVADGMGGAAAGEKASALAVECVEDFVLQTLKWFLHLDGKEEHVLFDELRQAIERADRTVVERARADVRLYGMGTTLTLAYSVGADLYVVHAGDSRAYLFRGGLLEQITRDHTLVQVLVDGGFISPEQARHHERRNVVTNAVGGPHEGVFTEIRKISLQDGDAILLCSDGLTEPVHEELIAACLKRNPDPEQACAELVKLALDAGGPDNVTAVVARYTVKQPAAPSA